MKEWWWWWERAQDIKSPFRVCAVYVPDSILLGGLHFLTNRTHYGTVVGFNLIEKAASSAYITFVALWTVV